MTVIDSGDRVVLLTRWSGDVELGPVEALSVAWQLIVAGLRVGLR